MPIKFHYGVKNALGTLGPEVRPDKGVSKDKWFSIFYELNMLLVYMLAVRI